MGRVLFLVVEGETGDVRNQIRTHEQHTKAQPRADSGLESHAFPFVSRNPHFSIRETPYKIWGIKGMRGDGWENYLEGRERNDLIKTARPREEAGAQCELWAGQLRCRNPRSIEPGAAKATPHVIRGVHQVQKGVFASDQQQREGHPTSLQIFRNSLIRIAQRGKSFQRYPPPKQVVSRTLHP